MRSVQCASKSATVLLPSIIHSHPNEINLVAQRYSYLIKQQGWRGHFLNPNKYQLSHLNCHIPLWKASIWPSLTVSASIRTSSDREVMSDGTADDGKVGRRKSTVLYVSMAECESYHSTEVSRIVAQNLHLWLSDLAKMLELRYSCAGRCQEENKPGELRPPERNWSYHCWYMRPVGMSHPEHPICRRPRI